jgi:hypothetical protein
MKIDELERQLHTAAAEVEVSPLTLEEVRRRAGWERRRVGMASLAALLILGLVGVAVADAGRDHDGAVVTADRGRTALIRAVVEGESSFSYGSEMFEGVFDFDRNASRVRSTRRMGAQVQGEGLERGPSEEHQDEQIRIGDELWTSVDPRIADDLGIDARWTHEIDKQGLSLIEDDFDPIRAMDWARARFASVEPDGQERIDGRVTTRYRLVQRESGSEGGDGRVTKHEDQKVMWVDGEGRLRRLRWRFSYTFEADGSELKQSTVATLDVLEFGVDASTIASPDPSTVIEAEHFERLMERRSERVRRERCEAGGGTFQQGGEKDGVGQYRCSTPIDPSATTTTTVGSGAD